MKRVRILGKSTSAPKYVSLSDKVQLQQVHFRIHCSDGTITNITHNVPEQGGNIDAPMAAQEVVHMERQRHDIEYRILVKKDIDMLYHCMTFEQMKTRDFNLEKMKERGQAQEVGPLRARKKPYKLVFEVALPEFSQSTDRIYLLMSLEGQHMKGFPGPPLPARVQSELKQKGFSKYNMRIMHCDGCGNPLWKLTLKARVVSSVVMSQGTLMKFNKLLSLNRVETTARSSLINITRPQLNPNDRDDPGVMDQLNIEAEQLFKYFHINAHYVEAGDGTMLAYSKSVPEKARFSLILLCSPITATPYVVLFTKKLVENYGAQAFFSHYRGTGYSGGKRGAKVETQTYLTDLRVLRAIIPYFYHFLENIAVRSVRWNYPRVPVVLFSIGYAVTIQLMYAVWSEREPVDGYVFFVPDFDPPTSGAGSIWRGIMGPDESASAFEELDKPFGVWVPERAAPLCRVAVTYGNKPAVRFPISVRSILKGLGTNGVFGLGWVPVGDFCSLLAKNYLAPASPRKNMRRCFTPPPSTESLTSNLSPSEFIVKDLDHILGRIEGLPLGEIKYREGRDGIRLAYAFFPPKNELEPCRANIIIVFGISFHRGWAKTLNEYNARTYVMELRGSGFSGGKRGYTPNKEAMWSDITTIINCIKYDSDASTAPTILMADGLACGFVINYLTWPGAVSVDGVLLLSPFLLPSERFQGTQGVFGKDVISVSDKSNNENVNKDNNGVVGRMTLKVPETIQNEMGWPCELGFEYISSMLLTDPTNQLARITSKLGVWVESDNKYVSSQAVISLIDQSNKLRPENMPQINTTIIPSRKYTWLDKIPNYLTSFINSFQPPPRAIPIPDSTLEEYQMSKCLGTGMLGIVYLAEYTGPHAHQMLPSNRYYALKKMRKKDVVREEQVHHVIQERQILSAIEHPFIIQFIASFQTPTDVYVVLEYAIAGEVFTHLKLFGRLPEVVVKFIAAELILAIDYLHRLGIIYRDLKPTNIMLDMHGHVKLVDFGFARYLPIGEKTTTFCGTVEYLAPEIIEDIPYDRMVDWWALGVCCHELLANELPFHSKHSPTLAAMIVQDPVGFPVYFSDNAKSFIGALMTKTPEHRMGYIETKHVEFSAAGIKNHPWLNSMDWAAIANLRAPSPLKPKFASFDDTSNFIDYKLNPDPAEDQTDYGDLFKDF